MDTFPFQGKKTKTKGDPSGSEDAEDDLSSEFFITKRRLDDRRRDVKVTDAGPGPNFLEILIFAASVCLWITSSIFIGCHIVVLTWKTKSYSFMVRHGRMMAFVILQIVSTVVEFSAAICASLCCSYDVEAHNVITVAKAAIGFVSCNIGLLTSVLVMGTHEFHGPNKEPLYDPSCSGDCGHGLDIIAHLFVGCSYEGIAINLCTIPVLIWVLKEAIVFVKLDLQARNEKAVVRESPSTTDIHNKRHLAKLHSDSTRKVRFSRSHSSLIESILPEVKIFKKLPVTPVQNEARDAVLRIMSEDWSSPPQEVGPVKKVAAGSKRQSTVSAQETKSSAAESASSVDPWSTTSPSTSDDAKDF